MTSAKKVILYGAKDCPWTEKAKHALEENGATKFKFKDVLESPEAKKEMLNKTSQYSTPVIEINGKIIIGYNLDEIKRELA